MIAIIAAMTNEVSILKSKIDSAVTAVKCGMECTSGTLCGKDAVIIKSGIGKVAAAAAAAVALSVFGADTVINTGLAAGRFDVGTVMIADRCVQYDFDMTAEGLPMGQSSDFDSPFFDADKALCDALCRALKAGGVKFERTAIASGDAFVADGGKMRRICDEFDVGGVDMESGAVAQVCASAGVRFAVLRAVSDNGDSHADYMTFAPKVCEVFSSALLTFFREKK